jgi:hypothetical protein
MKTGTRRATGDSLWALGAAPPAEAPWTAPAAGWTWDPAVEPTPTTGAGRTPTPEPLLAARCLAERAMVRTAAQADARGAVVELRGEGALVRGDPSQLVQVLATCIAHAVQATPPGGRILVTLRVEHVTPPAGPTAMASAHQCIEVADGAKAAPGGLREGVLGPVAPAPGVVPGREGDLAVVALLARRWGGWLEVRRRSTGGAARALWLPVAAAFHPPVD